ncbi:class I SAM-dependent methyltransferase [Arenibaculum pallidiluteum]|uniref:class I SAM-dependent methyltransferase n=1 Tax=Arenibaculum pallidiluteum TaxID=2812559 RepID=UPI001A96D138|nr:methyltransferase domain-containing protein [Arenibaculum pallidiluteum]
MTAPILLHIGGRQRRDGWTILDAEARPEVDIVGSCTNLRMFADGSVQQIYASHVVEHLDFARELAQALREFGRVLAPGGVLMIAVPDLRELCRIYLSPGLSAQQRWGVMELIYGTGIGPFDFHKTGFDFETLSSILGQFGFADIRQVERFNLFHDTSTARVSLPGFENVQYSLNVTAVRRP